jgi:hypothetical protein
MCEKAAKENDLKTQYNLIRSLKRSNYIRNREVRDKQGNKLKADKEILNRWKELFEEIYAQQEINQGVKNENNIEILNIDTEKIGKDESRAALKRMKDGRAPRGDNIPTELLKADTEQTVEILQRLSNMIWEKEEIPNEWKEGVIIKIPKKGHLTKCDNWRAITLLPTVSIVIARILLETIKPKIWKKLRKNQAGFQARCSTIDHIMHIENNKFWNTDRHKKTTHFDFFNK